MSNNIDLTPVKQELNKPGNILVLFGKQTTVDNVAAALALYLSFKDQGKDVAIASPSELRAEFSRLVGLDDVTDSISNRDLVIGFENYEFSSIEKVSHNEGANNRFELIIQPKVGKKAPDAKSVSFGYRGADANLIFLVGVNRLEDLGDIYEGERNLFTRATTVSFNRRQNPSYASVSIIDPNASSLCEMAADFLTELEMSAKDDVATNLLAGIDFATNRFQNPMISPTAFIVAGQLMQNGAKRQPPRLNTSASGGFMPFVPPSAVNQPPTSGQGPKSQPSDQDDNSNQKNGQQKPPQDWLQPKIYKGSSRV